MVAAVRGGRAGARAGGRAGGRPGGRAGGRTEWRDASQSGQYSLCGPIELPLDPEPLYHSSRHAKTTPPEAMPPEGSG